MILGRIAFIVFVFAITAEANDQSFPAGLPMMPATKVQLILSENENTVVEYPSRPCVYNDRVNLIPGEVILIDAEIIGNKLVNLKHVSKVEHPERTIEWSFTQNKDSKCPYMVLRIKNPFDKGLIYQEDIQRHGRETLTSSCTVVAPAKIVSFESWPYPLTRIQLRNFHLNIPANPED